MLTKQSAFSLLLIQPEIIYTISELLLEYLENNWIKAESVIKIRIYYSTINRQDRMKRLKGLQELEKQKVGSSNNKERKKPYAISTKVTRDCSWECLEFWFLVDPKSISLLLYFLANTSNLTCVVDSLV